MQTRSNCYGNGSNTKGQEHVNNILNIHPILKSSDIELRGLIDTINNNIAALEVQLRN
jgi:hypothetical protein